MGNQPTNESLENTSTAFERTGLSKVRLWGGGVFLFVVVIAIASACTGSPDEEPGSTSTPQAPVVSLDDQYVDLVRSETTTLDAVSDSALIILAEETCSALDRGATTTELIVTAMDELTSGAEFDDATQTKFDDTVRMMGIGISAYCPEHGEDL